MRKVRIEEKIVTSLELVLFTGLHVPPLKSYFSNGVNT